MSASLSEAELALLAQLLHTPDDQISMQYAPRDQTPVLLQDMPEKPKMFSSNLETLAAGLGLGTGQDMKMILDSDLVQPFWREFTAFLDKKREKEGKGSNRGADFKQLLVILNESKGTRKFARRNPDKSEWKESDHVAYLIHDLVDENLHHNKGLLKEKGYSDDKNVFMMYNVYRYLRTQYSKTKADRKVAAAKKTSIKSPKDANKKTRASPTAGGLSGDVNPAADASGVESTARQHELPNFQSPEGVRPGTFSSELLPSSVYGGTIDPRRSRCKDVPTPAKRRSRSRSPRRLLGASAREPGPSLIPGVSGLTAEDASTRLTIQTDDIPEQFWSPDSDNSDDDGEIKVPALLSEAASGNGLEETPQLPSRDERSYRAAHTQLETVPVTIDPAQFARQLDDAVARSSSSPASQRPLKRRSTSFSPTPNKRLSTIGTRDRPIILDDDDDDDSDVVMATLESSVSQQAGINNPSPESADVRERLSDVQASEQPITLNLMMGMPTTSTSERYLLEIVCSKNGFSLQKISKEI